MSTFAHLHKVVAYSETLGTDVPARWDNLIARHLDSSVKTDLTGITRTIYEAPDSTGTVHGEIWQAPKSADTSAKPPTIELKGGNLQMYVVSGSGAVNKNGRQIFLRPGEKISLAIAGDILSFTDAGSMKFLVRNEGAVLGNAEPVQPPKPITPAPFTSLYIPSTSSRTGTSARNQQPEPTSSRGYARSKAG
jgi:hypothetical protein